MGYCKNKKAPTYGVSDNRCRFYLENIRLLNKKMN